jgi:hypothetical protein
MVKLRAPSGRARSAAYLAVLVLALNGVSYAWQVHSHDEQQAAQQRQGVLLEQKLCTTFGRLAALKPPPGNPVANPSRAYLQEEHAALVDLGSDLGCRGSR